MNYLTYIGIFGTTVFAITYTGAYIALQRKKNRAFENDLLTDQEFNQEFRREINRLNGHSLNGIADKLNVPREVLSMWYRRKNLPARELRKLILDRLAMVSK